MMFLYLFMRVLRAHRTEFCEHGEEMKAEAIIDLTEAIGEWSLVYDWDSLTIYEENFLHYHSYCPKFKITKADEEDIEHFKATCGAVSPDFNWDKVKLMLSSPEVIRYDRLVAEGDTEHFVLERCTVTPIVLRKVNSKLLVVYPEIANVTLLLSKRPPKVKELKCINDNLDDVRNLRGVSFCYK